jgi:peptide deformylase
MHDDLKIIYWPDPRLLKMSKPVSSFDPSLRALAERMFVLMREAKGVGLAAPQVGQNLRMFVINPTGEPQDDRVYVNPILTNADGEEEGEEGCLSLPGIHVNITRNRSIHISARDLDNVPIEQDAAGYIARIWQHEYDHLNGTLLTDRMGPVARMANRKTLSELRADYEAANPPALPKKSKKR